MVANNISENGSSRRLKPCVLVLIGHYLPGERGGGPIRSIANLVDVLGDEFNFRIVTLNRDLGGRTRYTTVQMSTWVETGKAHVWYLAPGLRGAIAMVRLMLEIRADVVYLNSYFSFLFSILPVVLLSLLPRTVRPTIVLAPRGEFSLGALRFKAVKKRAFLTAARWTGLYRGNAILFQASSIAEAEDVRRQFTGRAVEIARDVSVEPIRSGSVSIGPKNTEPGSYPRIVIALNLAAGGRVPVGVRAAKGKGYLDVAWMSRIVRKKNLDGALSCLSGLHGDVRFTIYGPVEDQKYWSECRQLMSDLPNNVRTAYGGQLNHADVVVTLEKHHVFFFPTHGENYGYVICEALSAGCPVIVSDQTPWCGLVSAGVGWDISVDDHKGFVSALQECVDMSPDVFDAFSARARAYAAVHRSDPAPVEQHRRLFRAAVALRMRGFGVTGVNAA
jgi:glycosyltransferase involved in cell wall biosynthesis